MKVGDMVRVVVDSDHSGELGLVLRAARIDSADWIVLWNSGAKCAYPVYQLEVINASR